MKLVLTLPALLAGALIHGAAHAMPKHEDFSFEQLRANDPLPLITRVAAWDDIGSRVRTPAPWQRDSREGDSDHHRLRHAIDMFAGWGWFHQPPRWGGNEHFEWTPIAWMKYPVHLVHWHRPFNPPTPIDDIPCVTPPVPEPSSLGLGLAGIAALGWVRRKHRS